MAGVFYKKGNCDESESCCDAGNDSCCCCSDIDSVAEGETFDQMSCWGCESSEFRPPSWAQFHLYQCAMWHWLKFNEYIAKFYDVRGDHFKTNQSCQCKDDADLDESEDAVNEAKMRRKHVSSNASQQSFVRRKSRKRGRLRKQIKSKGSKKGQYNERGSFQMELNEDFRKFLEISSNHRKEREKSRQILDGKERKGKHKWTKHNEENNEPDILYYDASKKPFQPTTSPPVFVDKRKTYKDMYGEDCEMILNLESELQLHFDQFCDEKKPIYWPCIPLKF